MFDNVIFRLVYVFFTLEMRLFLAVTTLQVDEIASSSIDVAGKFFTTASFDADSAFLIAVYLNKRANLDNIRFELLKHCGSPIVALSANSRVKVSDSPNYDEMVKIVQNRNRRTQYFRTSGYRVSKEGESSGAWSRKCFVSRIQDIGPYVPSLEVSLAAWAIKYLQPLRKNNYLLIYSNVPPCEYPGESDDTNYCLKTVKGVVQGTLNRNRRNYEDQVIYIAKKDDTNYLVYDFQNDEFIEKAWADGLNVNDLLP